MYIPFPERIAVPRAVLFASLLVGGLVASGTGIFFSAMVFVFVITATLAFNVCGGLSRTSGAYVFFFSTLAVILGLCVKVALWEPTELYMRAPLTTMAMYTGGIVSMFGAAYLSRRFSRSQGLLQDVCSTKDMRLAAIGCVVGGIVAPEIARIVIQNSDNAVLIPIAIASYQLNRFLPMAIILGVTYEIKSSGGQRSTNFWVWLAGFWLMFEGFILGYSKEGLFTPPVCWLLSAAALRYRLRTSQVIGLSVFAFLCVFYFVPYCQYGRIFRDEDQTTAEKLQVSIGLLSNLNEVREKNHEADESVDRKTDIFVYFSRPMGLFDRLTMMGIDDKLVAVTDEKGAYGLAPLEFYFASIVPKFIWKGKPYVIMGNVFAHEIGYNEEDSTTGISFSPVVDGYHEAKWFGVFVECPLVWFTAFFILDSLCGDVRKSPWGLLMTLFCAHTAPEGMLQGIFYQMTYGALAVVVVAFMSAYVMPMLAHFVSPPKRNVRPIEAKVPTGRPAFVNARPAPTEL